MKTALTLLLCAFCALLGCSPAEPQNLGQTRQRVALEFTKHVVANIAGDCKMAGDVDGDGFTDLLIAGSTSEGLRWYEYPSWTETFIASPNVEFTTDGAAGDVDGDGDLDVVVPDGPSGSNLVWFRNPRIGGGSWSRQTIGAIGSWGKDVELADFDSDGRLDVATRSETALMIFFQNAGPTWTKITLSVANLGTEGLASGDLDGDGDPDLVVRGAWLRNPGGVFARSVPGCEPWTQHAIGAVDTDFKALIANIDGQPGNEVIFSSSENTADVRWWKYGAGGPTGMWTGKTIAAGVNRAHTLQAADFDGDGNLDVVIGQMHTSTAKELALYLNGGAGASWTKQVIDSVSGLHNGVVLDVGNDGFWDVYGANWTGNPPLHLWRSQEAAPDTDPPVISSVLASGITVSSATISWATDEPATSQVEYGLTASYGRSSSPGPALVTAHGVTLTGLDPETLYHFRVISEDASENVATSGDFTFTTLEEEPPPSNLVAWWKCDEGAGTTVADSVGTLHGTAQGSTWTSGVFGSACAFNGTTSQHVALGSFNFPANAFTVTFHARVTAFNSQWDQRFISKAIGSQADQHIVMISETDSGGRRLRARVHTNGSTTTLIASSGTLVAGTTFHAALTFNGSQMCLFKDAAAVGCASKSGTVTQNTAAVNLGRNPDASNPLNGWIDDLRIYDVALSASEIAAVMAGN
jgi:hypothetical protein